MKKTILFALAVFHFLAFTGTAQTTEDFETGYGAGDKRFNDPSGQTFDFTGDFRVANVAGIGANSSNWFFDTGFQLGNTNNPTSEIVSTNTNLVFEIISMDVWTSADDGVSEVTGPITFVGTLKAGGTVTETITIAPTGPTGADWDHVNFAGTALQGVQLSKIGFLYGGNINYLAGDNFEYILTTPVGLPESQAPQVDIYPNPSVGKVTIDLGEPGQIATDLSITDISGKVLHRQHIETSKIEVDISFLPTGIYNLHISASGTGSSRTFEIVKTD